ncbi:MAG: hypothetical protein WCC37_12490 [Candidatus Sulfotelmatobacter sp.]|jgi:hypothetical protein
MLKTMLTVFILASAGLAQSSSDGSFSVHDAKHANVSLTPAQMREAESLYQSACVVVRHDFPTGAREFHPPHFTVVIGADRNEVHGNIVYSKDAQRQPEIWLKKWSPMVFAEGVVVLAFDQLLTFDLVAQLGNRAVRYSGATVDVSSLK